jgi:cell division protein FtsL
MGRFECAKIIVISLRHCITEIIIVIVIIVIVIVVIVVIIVECYESLQCNDSSYSESHEKSK